MYRKLTVVSIIVLLLSLAFASVSYAQTGTQDRTEKDQNQTQNQDQGQGGNWNNAFNSLAQGGRNLQAGKQDWYAFQYAGDNSPIQIRLSGSNLQFSVWTQQDIQNANGNFGASASPVGRSTANSQFGGDQYWTGSFNAPGTYYVMVESVNGGNGGRYTLQVTGSGVSWRGNQGQAGNNQQGQSGTNTTGAANNASGSTTNNTSGSTANNTSGSGTNSSTSGSTAQGGVAPSTLPQTGGEMASVFPMVIGGLGALSVAAGAVLRRKK